MPAEEFVDQLNRLNGELIAASGAGDDERAGQIYGQTYKLKRLNAMPEAMGFKMPATAAQLAELDKVPFRVLGVGG